MARHSVLTDAEVQELLAFPESPEEIVQHYTLNEEDIALVRQHRGKPQHLGFAVMLCAMRYPGILPDVGASVPESVLKYVGGQIGIRPDAWYQYARRLQTRRSHLVELQKIYGFRVFRKSDYKNLLEELKELAVLTDRGMALGEKLVELLLKQKILAPGTATFKTICSEAATEGTREVYNRLLAGCDESLFDKLDQLLTVREQSASSTFAWLIEPSGKPTPSQIVKHLKRLDCIDSLGLPQDADRRIHQNRLRKLAREGRQMSTQHLRNFEKRRRYATLVAGRVH